MDGNKNCTLCNRKIEKDTYKKDKFLCKNCSKKKEKKKSNNNKLIQNQQPKIENVNNKNNRALLVGPFFSGKTYPTLKSLSRTSSPDFQIIRNSPPEQYSNSEMKNRETGEEIKPLNEDENAITVFDVLLGSSTSRYEDQQFIRG